MTWIGGILFAWLHRSGTLDPMYYTPPDEERPWMEFAFAWRSHKFCNDRCKSSRTTCETWFWGCDPTDSVIGPFSGLAQFSGARSDVSWPETNWGIRVAANPIPFSFGVMPSDVLSQFGIGKAFDAFCLMAVGMFLSSFAVRRIGMAFVPRLLSLAGVTPPTFMDGRSMLPLLLGIRRLYAIVVSMWFSVQTSHRGYVWYVNPQGVLRGLPASRGAISFVCLSLGQKLFRRAIWLSSAGESNPRA